MLRKNFYKGFLRREPIKCKAARKIGEFILFKLYFGSQSRNILMQNDELKICLDSLSLKDSGAWRQRGGKDVNCKGEFHTHPLRPSKLSKTQYLY